MPGAASEASSTLRFMCTLLAMLHRTQRAIASTPCAGPRENIGEVVTNSFNLSSPPSLTSTINRLSCSTSSRLHARPRAQTRCYDRCVHLEPSRITGEGVDRSRTNACTLTDALTENAICSEQPLRVEPLHPPLLVVAVSLDCFF